MGGERLFIRFFMKIIWTFGLSIHVGLSNYLPVSDLTWGRLRKVDLGGKFPLIFILVVSTSVGFLSEFSVQVIWFKDMIWYHQ